MKRVCEKERDETEFEDYSAQTNLVTAAGTVLLMACVDRAGRAILVEQWRGWVFLLLNLILLAVAFMSISPSSSFGNSNGDDGHPAQQKKVEETKQRRKDSKWIRVGEGIDCHIRPESVRLDENNCRVPSEMLDAEHEEEEEEEEGEGEGEELSQLSKEELNERVEAFISMVRRQLASDAVGTETCKDPQFRSSPLEGMKGLTVKV